MDYASGTSFERRRRCALVGYCLNSRLARALPPLKIQSRPL